MKLVIEVELGNDAMRAPFEAAAAIRKALHFVNPWDSFTKGDSGKIFDANGNMVGGWLTTDSEGN